MLVYKYQESPEPGTFPHDEPLQIVSMESLAKLGVLHWTITHPSQVEELCLARQYSSRDSVVISKDSLGEALGEKLKLFFTEHYHDDEEIRYIVDGSGYFDIRDQDDDWVRMHTPAGSYHRFTLDSKMFVHAMRLFKTDPVWTPINRSELTDGHSARLDYVASLSLELSVLPEPL